MFRKCVIFTLFLIIGLSASTKSAEATTSRQLIIEKQIKILLLKIEQLKLQLAELRALRDPTLSIKKVEPLRLLDQSVVNTLARSAVVNILCESNGQGPFRSISGSGVTIDPRGVILTNAHIGQYFLVRDYPSPDSMRCIIRTGSPATPAYEARLMFLPQAWVNNNPLAIRTSGAIGTGEDDYALLAITGSATNSPLPTTFPHVPFDANILTLTDNHPVLLASYPGELVGSIIIKNSLSMTSAVTGVKSGFYFEGSRDKNLDLLDISGTIISQAGSSGGAAVSLISGKLIGIIVTATEAANTSTRELRAINLAHINRSMQKYTNRSLEEFLQQSPISAVIDFETNTAPIERNLLIR